MFKAKVLFIGPNESGKTVLANFLSDTADVGGEYRPTQGVSHLKEIETWYSMFISSQSLQESQCLLIAHHKPGSAVEDGRLPLASHLGRLPLIHSNLEEEPEDVKQAFCKYLGSVVKTMSESREREEMSIIT
ncbi:hypothetical protein JOQ06_000821 [Pogonophryne albipinna]|uniref:Intraflagellar transport protein 22 homolog n=1 Tax=Pogonophryne albipinna TaxID=1090488 RepID=A0AAD6FJR1_9TELE|nr:hypothetical protein JOQ06_000821 [Pogonophryne albipinna]